MRLKKKKTTEKVRWILVKLIEFEVICFFILQNSAGNKNNYLITQNHL